MTLQQIDTLCDEFESALKKGETVRIEDVLPKIDEAERAALLQELLEVEIQFVSDNAPPDSNDSLAYTQVSLSQRFPEKRRLIESLCKRLSKLQQIGDYEIISELGRGGMGIVYKAKHKLLQQPAAIKVLSQAMLDDSQAVGRFHREIKLIGGLTHPNIVRALNAGEDDGTHYLAMEFVDGITLQKLVETVRTKNPKKLPVIPLGAACEAIRQAALGLQNVHEFKLIHRDIKPANLMLDYRGTVKILDLGLGKFADEHRTDEHNAGLTMKGMVLGTVDYISPEQCENSGEADIRSDLYSLGCSLFYLLTGKPVYSGSQYDTIRKKLMAHIVSEVPSLKQIFSGVPPELDAILHKVLAKDPAERFQTPIEFAEALAPFASFDELWELVLDAVPANSTDTPSGVRYPNSPYSLYVSKKDIAPPVNRMKWMQLLIALHILVFGGALGAAWYFAEQHYREIRQEAANIKTQQETADAHEADAKECWNQWKMRESQTMYRSAISIRARLHLAINNQTSRMALAQARINHAMALWYQGNSRGVGGATSELESSLGTINKRIEASEQPDSDLNLLKMQVLEHLADFTLFGGAASGRFTERLIANKIIQYDEAAKAGSESADANIPSIRWKQAILLSLQGNVKQAQTLLEQNLLPENTPLYDRLVRQLAEAVVFHYQVDNSPPSEGQGWSGNNAEVLGSPTIPPFGHPSEGGELRNQKLRALQKQFSLQGEARSSATQPEIMELLLFCAEFLLQDAIKHEDWETLGEDISAITIANALFLRDYPGGVFFMRRFYDVLIHSATLVYAHSDKSKDKQKQIENIVRLLDRLRPTESRASADLTNTTFVFFFLPDTSKPEEGAVIVSPRDGREGAIYPLPITRQMVKMKSTLPPLDDRFLKQIAAEKSAGRDVRISWDDSAVWSRSEEALTESDYPYGEVLPLW